MSGGIESNIFGYIESNDSSFADSGDDTDFTNTNDAGDDSNSFVDDADASLQQQVQQRQTPRNEDDNLTDPLTQKPKGAQPKADEKKNGKLDGRPRTNAQGDLIDEQGNVIARNGRERRIAADNVRLKSRLEALEERNANLARQVADNQYLQGLPAKFNLDNDTVAEALQLAAQFQQNPVLAVRAITQKALAQGLDLRDIFDDETIPQLGVKAVKDLVDSRLKPFEEERTRAETVNRTTQEAQEQADAFLMDYPEANVHQRDIAALMSEVIADYADRGQKLSPYLAAEKAWQLIQQFGAEHQLDMSKPFREQVEARARQTPANGGKNSTAPNNGVRRTRPMPNGSGTSADTRTVQRRSQIASADDDTGSIVREAMKEAGYNFNS